MTDKGTISVPLEAVEAVLKEALPNTGDTIFRLIRDALVPPSVEDERRERLREQWVDICNTGLPIGSVEKWKSWDDYANGVPWRGVATAVDSLIDEALAMLREQDEEIESLRAQRLAAGD